MNETAQRIKELLNQRGWSEYRLANECNLSQSTISNIFNRDTIPSIPTLDSICKALGISLAQFFSKDSDFYPLTHEEQTLIKEWAALTSSQKSTLFSLIENFKESN